MLLPDGRSEFLVFLLDPSQSDTGGHQRDNATHGDQNFVVNCHDWFLLIFLTCKWKKSHGRGLKCVKNLKLYSLLIL